MTTAEAPPRGATPPTDRKPIIEGRRPAFEHVLLYLFVFVPFIALVAAVPVAWGWGLSWRDLVIGAVFYAVGCLGVTVGYHRYFTHGAFKAKPWLRVALAVAGSIGFQGSVVHWVADHRRHHAFSDREGDPHSPWRFGESTSGMTKGFIYAHIGWLFDRDETNAARFAPDLLADRAVRKVDSLFPAIAAFSLLGPALIGGLWSWSWQGAVTAFFWAGLVRVSFLHHVTWSTNSVCHMVGERPFTARDRSANFWPLAILSAGESWHNLHHADPTSARHGVLRGQIDISARLIWIFEKFGWAWQVRWPTEERLARISATPSGTP
jgi:stearoyl-CoA desaturase (delta-9 desaturase)